MEAYMYKIGKLCKDHKLLRSTLLYYDSVGLLKASERSKSNYRIYSEEDKAMLEQICIYREAGIAEESLDSLHAEFEKKSPEEHQIFLESLGIDEDAIKYIRDKAKINKVL